MTNTKQDPPHWLTKHTTVVNKTPIFNLQKVSRAHPDAPDKEVAFWQITPPDWVNIIALTPEDKIVLVRQYRHGTDSVTLEIPGGMMDPGESIEDAAARELREETGFVCEQWQQLGTIEVNPAFMTNSCVTMLGVGAKEEAEVDFDEHEECVVDVMPIKEFYEAIDSGIIQHGIVVSAAYYLLRHQAQNS